MSGERVDDLMVGTEFSQELAIDFGATVQLEIDGVEMRLQSQFVGMLPGKFVVVSVPSVSALGGVTVKLFCGNRVVVRYVHHGVVYGFETTIMEAISSPVRLLFLVYPRVINERSVRASQRVTTKLPAKLGLGDDAAPGTITDISARGCQFEIASDSLPADFKGETDTETHLRLQLPGVVEEYEVSGQLKNVEKVGRLTRLGIAFAELDEQVQTSIEEYVNLSS